MGQSAAVEGGCRVAKGRRVAMGQIAGPFSLPAESQRELLQLQTMRARAFARASVLEAAAARLEGSNPNPTLTLTLTLS